MDGGGSGSGRDERDVRWRGELRGRLDRYLDLPLALASVLIVLLAVLELSGEVGEPWRGRVALLGWFLWALFFAEFAVKFALSDPPPPSRIPGDPRGEDLSTVQRDRRASEDGRRGAA